MSDTMTPIAEESLKLHYAKRGKIEVISTVRVQDKNDLSLAYTPGVAQPCLEIQKDVDKSYELTRRWNMCLVATDGSAVLGLGDIGPEAGMPVMEGKCVLFKEFGGVDAFPPVSYTHLGYHTTAKNRLQCRIGYRLQSIPYIIKIRFLLKDQGKADRRKRD